MNIVSVKAEKRVGFGKNANKALRDAGLVPAKIDRSDNEFVALSESFFTETLKGKKLISHLFDIEINGVIERVVLKEYQTDPVTGKVTNLDFVKIHSDKFIELTVPIFYVNKSKSIAIKKGAFLNVSRYFIKLKCLGENIKEYFTIDLDGSDIDNEYRIESLELPKDSKLIGSPHDVLGNFRGKRGNVIKE